MNDVSLTIPPLGRAIQPTRQNGHNLQIVQQTPPTFCHESNTNFQRL